MDYLSEVKYLDKYSELLTLGRQKRFMTFANIQPFSNLFVLISDFLLQRTHYLYAQKRKGYVSIFMMATFALFVNQRKCIEKNKPRKLKKILTLTKNVRSDNMEKQTKYESNPKNMKNDNMLF